MLLPMLTMFVLHPAGPRPEPQVVAPAEPSSIVGGDPAAEGEHPEVVDIEVPHDGGTALCTGTLVAPTLVLTAAHCFDHEGVDASTISVRTGNDADDPTATLAAEAFEIHPDFCSAQSGDRCEWANEHEHDLHDFAWIRLASDAGVTSLPAFITDEAEHHAALHTGATVTLLGFGRDDSGAHGVLRAVSATVGSFAPDGADFHIDGRDGHDACKGDSGGPALVQRDDGTWALVGVLSRGPSDCGTEDESSVYGVPLPVLAWVSEASGVDVVPAACTERLDAGEPCVDLTPRDDDQSDRLDCRIAREAPSGWTWLVLALLVPWAGRRRLR